MLNEAAWDKLRAENAIYYIWKEANDDTGIFIKHIMSSKQDVAIESFVSHCKESDAEFKRFQKCVLLDKTGAIIKVLPESPEHDALLGTCPFNEIPWRGPETLSHLPAIEHVWHQFNNQPYYESDHKHA